MPKYPNVEVELVGGDGNAFAIIGAVKKACRKAKIPSSVFEDYRKEAMSGDYDNLLRVTMEWFEVY